MLRRFSSFPILLFALLCMACRKNYQGEPVVAVPVDANNVAETVPPVLSAVTKPVNNAIGGYYAALPARYNLTTRRYPLLLFLPGGGQMGNGQIDLPLILNDGVMQLVDEKKFPSSFTVNSKVFSFIVLSPQFSYYPSNAEVESFIVFAIKNYRVDTARIYLSGLSMGGILTTDMGAEFTAQFAAIAPMAGVYVGAGLQTKVQRIAQGNLPVWAFHNTGDPVNSVSGVYDFINGINGYHPAIAPLLTLFAANVHDSWTRAIDPSYKENKMNIYEWMLQYTR